MTDQLVQTISIFETASIQQYVFGSPRLRENLGGSQLVQEAMETRLIEELGISGIPWTNAQTWNEHPEQAEVMYVGGGNAVVRFPSMPFAHEATFAWSRKLLEYAPELRVAG